MKMKWLYPVVASALLAASSASEVNGQASRFQQVLNAARKEAAQGPFVVYASNPREEKTRQALFDAFKKKFGLSPLCVERLRKLCPQAQMMLISLYAG